MALSLTPLGGNLYDVLGKKKEEKKPSLVEQRLTNFGMAQERFTPSQPVAQPKPAQWRVPMALPKAQPQRPAPAPTAKPRPVNPVAERIRNELPAPPLTQFFQSFARIPEQLVKTVSQPLVDVMYGRGKVSTSDTQPNTGFREAIYGREPVKNYFDIGKDVTGGNPAGVFLAPVLGALDATPLGGARKKVAEKVVEQLPKATAKELPKAASKQRGFVTSVKGSPEVSQATKQATEGAYDVRSTTVLQKQAEKFAGGSLKKVADDINTRLDVKVGSITDREVADAIAVAKRLDSKKNFEAASSVYEKLAEHLTKLGQSVQAASLLSRRTPEGLKYKAVKDLSKAGVKLTPDKQKQLDKLVAAVRATKPESEARNRAVYDVTRFVSNQIPSSVVDRAVNIWRAGLLTAPRTLLGNLTGNTGEALTRKLFVTPVATAADKLLSLATGKRTQTVAPFGSGIEGAKTGFSKLPDFIKTGYDQRNVLNKYDAKAVNFGDSAVGKAASAYVNGVYRLMSVADQPFYYSAFRNVLGSIAKAEAINARVPAAGRAQWIKNFIDKPPKAALERAAQEAAYSVFQNKTGLGQAAVAFKEGLNKILPGVGDFIVPFTQVPASIATRVITRTPIGTAIEAVKQFRNVRKGGKFDQRAMAQSIGEGAFGTAVLGTGYALANSGLLTFGYPEDQKERELWELQGKQPYSIKIGDRWYSFNYMQPFGTLLAIGAKAGEKIEAGEDYGAAIATAAATAGQSIANQSFVKGMSSAIDAVTDPERSTEKFVNQTASSLIPNFVRSLAAAVDPLQRETEGPVDAFKSGVPGARQTLPAKQDAFGQDVPRNDDPVNTFLNPLKPSKVRGDSVTDELQKLQDAEQGTLPTAVPVNAFDGVKLTEEQKREFTGIYGPEVKDAWQIAIGDGRYTQLADSEQKGALQHVNNIIYGALKIGYGEQNGLLEPGTKGLSKIQQAYLDGSVDASGVVDYVLAKLADEVAAKPKATAKGRSTARATSGRRTASRRGGGSAGSAYKYAVSPNAGGGNVALPKATAKQTAATVARAKTKAKAKAKIAAKPKVTLKKSLA